MNLSRFRPLNPRSESAAFILDEVFPRIHRPAKAGFFMSRRTPGNIGDNSVTEAKLSDQNWPRPVGWRILVDPIKAKSISEGGILLTAESQRAETHLNYVGRVVAKGPLCYQHDKFVDGNPWCEVGDYVAYGQYAGQTIVVKDQQAAEQLKALRGTVAELEKDREEIQRTTRSLVGASDEALKRHNEAMAKNTSELIDARQKVVGAEQKVEHNLRLLNDDEILAVIPNKDAIRIYI